MNKETPQDKVAGDGVESKSEFDAAVGELRVRIDELDSRLVELLGERRAVVEKVVALKKAHHMPVYHPAREEDLISKRRSQAEGLGLDPEYIEEIFRSMLRQSRKSQNAQMAGVCVKPGGKVLIMGGTGAMGKCLVRWFDKAGYDVRSMGSRHWDQVEELCDGVDLAILSVPIDRTEELALRLAPHLPSDCVLADITSVKVEPVKAMLKAHPGPVLGIHPVFGPTTTSMERQIVVVTEGRRPDECQWVIDQMAAWGAVIVASTGEEHDEIMAIVQSLRHFATFSFGKFLHEQGVSLERSLDFSSPIYRLELGMVGRLFAQGADLYAEIIFATPERRQLLKEYVESLVSNLEMLAKADKDQFIEQFHEIAEWFGPFKDQAIRESTYMIDKLTERF